MNKLFFEGLGGLMGVFFSTLKEHRPTKSTLVKPSRGFVSNIRGPFVVVGNVSSHEINFQICTEELK